MTIQSVTVTLPVTELDAPAIVTANDVSIIALSGNEFIIAFKGDVDNDMARRIAERLPGFSQTIFYVSHYQGLEKVPELDGVKGQLKNMIRQAVVEQNLRPTPQDVEKFVPFPLFEGSHYYLFALEVDKCLTCDNLTHPHFSPYFQMNMDAQMLRAGIHKSGHLSVEREKYLCDDCTAKGMDTFTCYLCGKKRGVDLIEEQHGDPPDFLCKVCFETVSAKVWDEAQDKLAEKHQYDYS